MSTATTDAPWVPDHAEPSELAWDTARAGQSKLTSRHDLNAGERAQLEQMAYRYACVPESYDIVVSDGHVLRTPCGKGAISVLADGRFWHLAGGLLAPENLKPQMIDWLRALSEQQKQTLAVYNVSATDARRFRDAGFVVNKFGEEPLLYPRTIDWVGKKFEWVRRQTNFCTRAGVEIVEITDANEQRSLAETLLNIMTQDLAGRTFDKPLRLLEGEFDPFALRRRRLFVARQQSTGVIEAFLACSPVDGGRSWAFETYRKRTDATRGVTAFLFRSVIDQLRDEDVEQISLCLIPGRNVADAAIGNDDWRIEKALSTWFHRMDFVFNAKGQDHFKSRFRPRYVDRYLCVAPRNSVGSLWSFLKTTGAINCSWTNMMKQLRRSVIGR